VIQRIRNREEAASGTPGLEDDWFRLRSAKWPLIAEAIRAALKIRLESSIGQTRIGIPHDTLAEIDDINAVERDRLPPRDPKEPSRNSKSHKWATDLHKTCKDPEGIMVLGTDLHIGEDIPRVTASEKQTVEIAKKVPGMRAYRILISAARGAIAFIHTASTSSASKDLPSGWTISQFTPRTGPRRPPGDKGRGRGKGTEKPKNP
jgi:hypothetical protein